MASIILNESVKASVPFKECPRLINSLDLPKLVSRLHNEKASIEDGNATFNVIFTLQNDELGDITRAVQEGQILKTRIKHKKGGLLVELPSFWDVWNRDKRLSNKIKNSQDPNEEKWKCSRDFGYKIANTFMPLYAKSIYENFNAENVLDPCAGWGDRMIAAASTTCVKKYVCFDPNRYLRPGYGKLMNLIGHEIEYIDEHKMLFNNGFESYVEPFEIGAKRLKSESFDLVFTSPPFFDYEIYVSTNPKYNNWIDEFYTPLFIESARCVKIGGHVAIHIEDTSAGTIEPFLLNKVNNICSLRFVYKIGLRGFMSGQERPVWIFVKT